MYNQKLKLLQEIEVLSPELQQQVFDLVTSLKRQQPKVIKKRTVGEYKNEIMIHDDFCSLPSST